MSVFRLFPKELATIIADYCACLQLREWIQPEPIRSNDNIWSNPNAVEAGFISCSDEVLSQGVNGYIATNPAFIELIKKHPDVFLDRDPTWENPAALDWLIASGQEPAWEQLTTNPNPRAIEMLLANPDKIMWPDFCSNPGAMPYLRAHPERINEQWICDNPAAIDIIQELETKGGIWHGSLSRNPHPWAIEEMRKHWDEIEIIGFASNPGIFHYVTSKKLVKLLSR
jgi:hypothetical protein